jgi:hypothetical protein
VTRPSYEEAATTFLVPIDGSPVVRLDDSSHPVWSPDGRYLALQGGDGGVVSIVNGNGSGRVALPSGPVDEGGNIAWVPR